MRTADASPRIVKCPTCRKAVEWCAQSTYRPFCSARCRQIDIGAWASEAYRIPAATPPEPGQDISDD